MYKVVKMFTDLQDNGYAYKAGDEFPRHGLTVSAKRLAELSSNKNRRGIALIEEIVEKKPEPPKVVEEVEEVEAEAEATEVVEEKPAPAKSRKKGKGNKDAE